jgi:hypothetical protein
MSKRIGFPVVAAIVLALVAGLAASSSALAQGGGPLRRLIKARPVLGQVTAIGKSDFTVEKKDGTELTFKVDERTRYRSKEKTELAFSDLKTGQWVAVVTGGGQGPGGTARLVATLPEDFDPTQFEGARGKVIDVNPAANQFTLENREGQKTVVTTNPETVYRGEVTSLADLEVGMLAGVVNKEVAGDGMQARLVRAGNPGDRYMGEITKVNPSAGTFTLKTRRTGEEITFKVDENTIFRGREVQSLADLKAGMMVLVGAKDLGSGSYQALAVAALPRR